MGKKNYTISRYFFFICLCIYLFIYLFSALLDLQAIINPFHFSTKTYVVGTQKNHLTYIITNGQEDYTILSVAPPFFLSTNCIHYGQQNQGCMDYGLHARTQNILSEGVQINLTTFFLS